MQRKKVLLVDFYNTFIRSFATLTLATNDGRHMGGVMGFLQSLRYVISRTNPDRVIICWDEGRPLKREAIYKDYKIERRKKPRKTLMPFNDLDEQDDSFNHQISRVKDYIELLPVTSVSCGNVEADDLIAHFCVDEEWEDWDKVIYSTDKDFLQLVSEDVQIYHPIKKKLLDEEYVCKEFGVHPRNFAVLRSVTGDSSDSIVGVNGIGFKSALKWVPILGVKDIDVSTQDVVQYCQDQMDERKKPYKAHTSIVEESTKLEANLRVIQLQKPMLSLPCLDRLKGIRNSIDDELKFNPVKLRFLFLGDDANNLIENAIAWNTPFLKMVARSKKK